MAPSVPLGRDRKGPAGRPGLRSHARPCLLLPAPSCQLSPLMFRVHQAKCQAFAPVYAVPPTHLRLSRYFLPVLRAPSSSPRWLGGSTGCPRSPRPSRATTPRAELACARPSRTPSCHTQTPEGDPSTLLALSPAWRPRS